jgi:hypothetical protein
VTSPTTHPDRSRLAQLRPVSLTSRRRVVVAFGAAIVLTAVAGSLPDAPFLTLLGILVSLGLGVVLRWSVHSTADLPDGQLDERLIRERDAAYLISYQLIATVVVVLAVGLDIAVPFLERSSTTEVSDITRITGAFLPSIPPLALFAPSAVLAWRRTEV